MNIHIKNIFGPFWSYLKHFHSSWRTKYLSRRSPLKVIIGSGGTSQKGWIPTDIQHLNMLCVEDWQRYFKPDSIDAILAEHVWEHLTLDEAFRAAKNCYSYLKHNGYVRVAVPDGYHPSHEYREAVKPGGTGAGAEDHKILYNYKTFSDIFTTAGFNVELLEYFNENGNFCRKEWNADAGLIWRSSKHDTRNKEGELNYTSIILDAWKR